MQWFKRAGWGLLLWVIIFMWVTILMFGFKMPSGILMSILTWIAVIIAVWFLAGAAKVKNLMDGILVGLIFIVVGLIMDWFVTSKFSPSIFSSWSLWVGYGIILLIPVFRSFINKK